ncbi:MAG: aminopeptidase, partial [Clostridia bacterium]|nr:aminopeptidase [Clostridia bacterium]
ERQKHRVNTLPCRIILDSFDPDVLAGCDTVKLAGARQARAKVLKPYRDQMENKYQWCIAAVPGKAWAKKLFPELSEKKAVEKLWEYILKCSRADGRSPRAAWARHNSELARRCDYLNSLGLDSLHIKSGNGTDLTVGLIPGMQFMGGCESPLGKKLKFNPNIPSEEIFTSPDKARTEGVVYSTLPLSYNGKLIKSFSVRFENGKATEIKGSTDEETEILKTLIEMDEGACMLGETALVPYSSPIRESGVIYYNTLFDENAACHLALGMGFTNCMKDYEKFTQDELHGMGINDSIIHVDFMIGAADTEITGRTRDGRTVGIFKKGEWAFEV